MCIVLVLSHGDAHGKNRSVGLLWSDPLGFRGLETSDILLEKRIRGVVEWFIAPVLKTGDPLRGPGVRIPPPLLSINQRNRKPRIRNGFEVFLFSRLSKKSHFFSIRRCRFGAAGLAAI